MMKQKCYPETYEQILDIRDAVEAGTILLTKHGEKEMEKKIGLLNKLVDRLLESNQLEISSYETRARPYDPYGAPGGCWQGQQSELITVTPRIIDK